MAAGMSSGRIDLDHLDAERALPVLEALHEIATRAGGTRMRDGFDQARFGCLPPRASGGMHVEPPADAAE